MAEAAAFHIARIEYRIRSSDYPLRLSLDVPYQSFLGPVRSPGWIHPIELVARVGEPSIEPGWQLIFEAGEVWRLFASGSRRMIVRYAGHPPEALCAAAMDTEVRSVDVLCSERLVGATEHGPCLENPVHYPLDQLLLIRALGARGLLVHAAAAASGNRGVLLAGVSGAGKTTISRLLHAHGGFRLLSDDRAVLAREEDGFTLHGTPWPGEGGYALDEAVPLTACLVLRKGAENRFRRLRAAEAIQALLPAVSVFWSERDLTQQALSVCQALAEVVPVFEFFFTPDERAPRAVAEMLLP